MNLYDHINCLINREIIKNGQSVLSLFTKCNCIKLQNSIIKNSSRNITIYESFNIYNENGDIVAYFSVNNAQLHIAISKTPKINRNYKPYLLTNTGIIRSSLKSHANTKALIIRYDYIFQNIFRFLESIC